jgi:hypothetical protein
MLFSDAITRLMLGVEFATTWSADQGGCEDLRCCFDSSKCYAGHYQGGLA